MLDLDRRRFLFITGKGGVGKTTVSLAIAHALAERGRRVLLAVTGKKEPVSSVLGTPPLATEIREIAPRLHAVLLSAEVAIREYGHLKVKSRVLSDALFDNRYVQGFFLGAPGLKEWALLGKAWYHSIEEVNGQPRFDTVLFDAPATGHGLDMLRVPKVIVELAPPGPLRADAERAWRMFQDPKQSGVVVVTLPEDLPVNETEELVAALRTEISLPIAALVANQVRPELFLVPDRARLAALVDRLPLPASDGAFALSAGIRRAAREGIQAESLQRLHALGLPELQLPVLVGGAVSRASIETLAAYFTRSFKA